MSCFPMNATADEIPHENYDLVGTNLDVVISLLRSSITYSEFALISMYNESMVDADQNISVVQGLLTPAEQLLGKIKNVATSYENLSILLPPFADLSSQMNSFAGMEVQLLGARTNIVSASELENLTGDAMIQALDAVKRFNSLITQMNRSIDEMLVFANQIVNLTVDGDRPFTDNQLIPLIEKLRDLLRSLEVEMDFIVREGIPWTASQPFLLLWLSDVSYYLGEDISGGGYLYYNGSFQSGRSVDLSIDGQNLTYAITTLGGRYSFSYEIPLNASWLGAHSVRATASTPNGSISSDPIIIQIRLIPTRMVLEPSSTELSIVEQFGAHIELADVKGRAVENASCHLILDSANITFITDIDGSYDRTWQTSQLGYGTHSIQAFYDGELPYAPSSSDMATFAVNIPTNVSLRLFATRYVVHYFVVGNGTLHANGTEPLSDQEITLSIDGVAVANVTTSEDGEFAFTIPTEDMTLGGHTLRAEFLHRDIIWRYSSDQLGFSLVGKKPGKYPFFPVFPKWGNLFPSETFPYLFIGPNAYIFWLLVLTLVGVTVRVIQTRKREIEIAKREQEELIMTLDKVVEPTPAATMSPEDLARDLAKVAETPATPNERIVVYYQRLLAFLTRRGRVSLKASMTHWEVARLLKSLGYPSRPVENITVLFERAFYSGKALSDEDTVDMSTAVTGLVVTRATEVAHAV